MKFQDFTEVLKAHEDFISLHKGSFIFNFCNELHELGVMQKVQDIVFVGFSSTNVSIQYMFASGAMEMTHVNVADFKHWVENTSTIDVYDEAQELPCPYAEELYGDTQTCNCTDEQRYQCYMDI